MNTTKRIIGDWNIEAYNTNGTAGNVNLSGDLNVVGNLDVQGTTTTINTVELTVSDKIMTLNDGESGAGVTGNYSGIEVDRGTLPTVTFRWNDLIDRWEITNDGTNYGTIPTADEVAAFDLITDLTPQLGGDLDVNGFSITSVSNGNIVVSPNGTGELVLESVLTLQNQASAPSTLAGHNKLYSGNTPAGGDTGLYYTNTSSSDELISRNRALVFSLIF